jgi:peptidoglycan/xylan/chitin deacetylase (PgdA/CDA1 family)
VFILVYHRIVPETGFNPFSTKISVESFRRQIAYVKAHFPVISLGDLIRQYKHGIFEAPVQIVITFDDGYRDNYCCALPILKEFKVSATFFLVTDYIDTERSLWDYELTLILQSARGPVEEIEFPHIGLIGYCADKFEQNVLIRFNEALKCLPRHAREEVLHTLKQETGSNPELQSELDRCMTWEEVKEIHNAGMEIGAHSCSHSSLARIPLGEAIREIEESKTTIEERLVQPCISFAFPFGSERDFDDTLIKQVENSGFECCALNVDGYNYIDNSRFRLRRVIVTNSTDLSRTIG